MPQVSSTVSSTEAQKIRTAALAVERLEQAYPEAICSLEYTRPHELLIATRLAAQCTDARVNIVCGPLFETYRSIEDFANAKLEDIEAAVRPCGFYHTKARDIIALCKQLRDDYAGQVPDTVEELVKLSGVGRKTANLVVGDIYQKPAVVCDTHCIRITNLLGLTDSKDPFKVEQQLWKILPTEKSNDFCHRLVLHGRAICVARRPACAECVLANLCAHATGQADPSVETPPPVKKRKKASPANA